MRTRSRKLPKKNELTKNSFIPHPPPIHGFELRHKSRLRFITNAAVSQSITFYDLGDTILFATTALAPFQVFDFVKVNAIEVWSIATVGTSTSVEVTFNGIGGGAAGDNVTHTDTSMGIEPAHLRVSPSTRCLCSLFQPATSGNSAFQLNCPSGSVVDIILEYRGATNATTDAAQNASVGATVGATFWRGLDGLAVAATKFILPNGISQF